MDRVPPVDIVDLEEAPPERKWKCCKEDVPTLQIIYFTQVILIYIVVITCIINLAYGTEPRDLWTSLLASSVGLILPAPKLSS